MGVSSVAWRRTLSPLDQDRRNWGQGALEALLFQLQLVELRLGQGGGSRWRAMQLALVLIIQLGRTIGDLQGRTWKLEQEVVALRGELAQGPQAAQAALAQQQTMITNLQAQMVALQAVQRAQAAQFALQGGRTMEADFRNLGGAVQTVKGSAGTVSAVSLTNNSGASAWVQLFDEATPGAVVLGTTPPLWEFEMFSGGIDQPEFPNPLSFANGIQIAATTTEGGSAGSAAGVVAFVEFT